MRLYAPKEPDGEPRVPLIPDAVATLNALGIEIVVQAGLGASIHASDDAYKEAGAQISNDHTEALAHADMVIQLSPPSIDDVRAVRKGTIYLSYMDPFRNKHLVEACRDNQVTALSVEMIPRTTLAQKMDALSSQASLAGYVAVLVAINRLDKIVPMMMTPAGTLAPARVFIIGAGVAGLQAIATAKRLGARVEAFDTRPVVEEQVQSLGARFLKVDLGDTGQTAGGYARQLTDEQLAKQRAAMAKACAQADIVITTAQVFGRPAPRIITDAMIQGMSPGSIIVDMAVETGGNVEGSVKDEDVTVNGVTIIGVSNLAGQVPIHASQMYSSNVASFVEYFWDTEARTFNLNREDEIIQGSLLTIDGEIVNETIKERMA